MDHKPGSISDLVMFQCNLDFHDQALNKYGEDKDIADTTCVWAKFPENWTVLMDKGYQGVQQQVQAIICKKKPLGKILPLEDESWKATVASNCIIAENYFGHLTKLWGVILSKYRWAEEGYDDIFCLCVTLTNYHISFYLLRNNEDANHYQCYKNWNYIIGDKIEKMQNVSKNIAIVAASALNRILWTPLIVPSAVRVISWGGIDGGWVRSIVVTWSGVSWHYSWFHAVLSSFLVGLRSEM